jgi:hypothetical protein
VVQDVTFNRLSKRVAVTGREYKPTTMEVKKDIKLAKVTASAAGLRNIDGLWQSTDETSALETSRDRPVRP